MKITIEYEPFDEDYPRKSISISLSPDLVMSELAVEIRGLLIAWGYATATVDEYIQTEYSEGVNNDESEEDVQ